MTLDPRDAETFEEFRERLNELVKEEFLGKDRVLNERLLDEVRVFISIFFRDYQKRWFDNVHVEIQTGPSSRKDTLGISFHRKDK